MKNLLKDRAIVLDTGYLPLQVFRDQVQREVSSPYRSKFSIVKLIEKMRDQSCALRSTGIAQTIADLESIEARLQQTTESWETLSREEELKILMIHFFPSFFFAGQLGFIKGPSWPKAGGACC